MRGTQHLGLGTPLTPDSGRQHGPAMLFAGHTLAQFLARGKWPFSLFHGLQIVIWSFQLPTEKPKAPTFLFA